MKPNLTAPALISILLVAAGCSTPPAPPAAAPAKPSPSHAAAPAPAPAPVVAPVVAETIPPEAVEEATKIFNTRCLLCHGPNGKGDGPAAAQLTPKPRDYTSKEWQASVTDEHIEKVIVQGGAAVGLSNLMTPNPDLAAKPDVVRALRARVRSFGG